MIDENKISADVDDINGDNDIDVDNDFDDVDDINGDNYIDVDNEFDDADIDVDTRSAVANL